MREARAGNDAGGDGEVGDGRSGVRDTGPVRDT